jgi:formylglycine-generating enzyme required for sulfatase activity
MIRQLLKQVNLTFCLLLCSANCICGFSFQPSLIESDGQYNLIESDGQSRSIELDVNLEQSGDTLNIEVLYWQQGEDVNARGEQFVDKYPVLDNSDKDMNKRKGYIKTKIPKEFIGIGNYQVKLSVGSDSKSCHIIHANKRTWLSWLVTLSDAVDVIAGRIAGPGGSPVRGVPPIPMEEMAIWIAPMPQPYQQIDENQLKMGIRSAKMPSWSPDGKFIACSKLSDNKKWFIAIYEFDTDEPRQVSTSLHIEESDELYPTWSPDGHSIAFVKNGGLKIMNVDSNGDWQKEFQATDQKDIRQIIYWDMNGVILEINNEMPDAETESQLCILKIEEDMRNIPKMIFIPKPYEPLRGYVPTRGSLVYTKKASVFENITDDQIYEITADGKETTLLVDKRYLDNPLDVSSDGKWLAFVSNLKQVPVIITDNAGKEVFQYEKSYALIIGVSKYTNGWPQLPGVEKDIPRVKEALEKQGFKVFVMKNPTYDQMEQEFKSFINKYGRKPNDRLLFYFSGHGHTIKLDDGREMGYIVPADSANPNIDKNGFFDKAIDMEQIEVYAKRIQSKHALFMFDSCFSGSIFNISRAIPGNISDEMAKPIRQIVTAGAADEMVPDNSIFCRQLIEALNGKADMDGDGYVTGAELGGFLQKTVANYSKETQHPQYGKIRDPNLDKGEFVFSISPPKTSPKPPTFIGKDGAEMVLIPAGEFEMGSNDSSGEKPMHTVYLDAFYIDKYEVTNAQYKKFIDETSHRKPGYWKEPNYDAPNQPVVDVSWDDAKAYADWAGKRLPTEAEWEKAARGGLRGKSYPLGDTLTHDDANYDGTGGQDQWSYTSPVGSFSPNGYGLYDMAGNVWEWCADWYDKNYYANSPRQNPMGPSSGQYRVYRGGSWNTSNPDNIRVSNRDYEIRAFSNIGFRCVK